LKAELESHFHDADHERKLLNKFTSFTQVSDIASYISNYRNLVLELGDKVGDEMVLWQFIKGLKPNL
jgi:hypothetical protein